MFFQIIASSSSGNCSILRVGGRNFLIDAGVGVRKLESYLNGLGLGLGDVSGIFVTHDHSDHCKALPSFARFRNVSVFANSITRDCIVGKNPKASSLNWKIFENGLPFEFCGIRVNPFSLPHDAADTVGYSFSFEGRTLVWMTDLGKVTSLAFERAKEADILVLESNYCPKLLEKSDRSFILKQRINGTHGHLSNAAAIDLIMRLVDNFPRKIYLAHVSKECNEVGHIEDLLKVVPENFLSRIEIVPPFDVPASAFVED